MGKRLTLCSGLSVNPSCFTHFFKIDSKTRNYCGLVFKLGCCKLSLGYDFVKIEILNRWQTLILNVIFIWYLR